MIRPADKAAAGAALLGAAALLLLLLGGLPPGYPSNDAGAYHRMVDLWLEQGHPVFIGWNEMTLLGHLQTGVVLASLGLDSVEARQWMVAMQAVASVVLLLLLCRKPPNDERGRGALAALTWIGSPLVLVSATSFMTEVPFTLWILATLAAFAAWLRSGRTLRLLLVVVAAVAAFSVRQTAIVLVPALAVGGCRLSGRRGPLTWMAAAGVLVADGALWAWRSTLPLASVRSTTEMLVAGGLADRIARLAEHGVECAVTLGLLLVPIAAAALPVPRRRLVRLGVPITVVGALVLLACRSTFPFWGNILTRHGVLPDLVPHVGDLPVVIGPGVSLALTAAGLVSLAVLVSAADWRRVLDAPLERAAGIALVGLLVLVAVARSPFDRYTVPLAALGALLGACGTPRNRRAAVRPAVLLALAIAVTSAVAVRGVHQRQRAVWTTADRLVEAGVSARSIDGGFEWNMAHQPVPFAPDRARSVTDGDPWYAGYPFTELEPRRRLSVGEPPAGWLVSERHVIPGGLTLDVLAPADPGASAGDYESAHDLRTTPRRRDRPSSRPVGGSR